MSREISIPYASADVKHLLQKSKDRFPVVPKPIPLALYYFQLFKATVYKNILLKVSCKKFLFSTTPLIIIKLRFYAKMYFLKKC